MVCNKPYILVGNSCCLDSNKNDICDSDEVKEVKTEEVNELSCNLPYIKVGNNCCLDKNDNKICDNDEKQVVEVKPEVKLDKTFSINDLQSDINKVLDTPILLVKDSNTDKFQVYSDIVKKTKFLGKYGSVTYAKIFPKKPLIVIQIIDKNSYLKDGKDFYDFVRNNKNLFIQSAIKSKEIFENEFKNGELPKLIYLREKPKLIAFADTAKYANHEEISSKIFFDNITFPETVSKRIAQIFYVRVNKYRVNVSSQSPSWMFVNHSMVTKDLSNINLAYNMVVYCNPSLIISLNEECFGQGSYFCQGTGVSHDTDFDGNDVDANFFLTNLRAYTDSYNRWTQSLIDMCDQKYQFTYLKSTIT